ncbi:hypothetical protein EDC96DRAFT_512362 [Choanephora cucurbitarum]|nr:hypothetical protein EDC96DRAFT_512362 [Choanephora cucurbitarum]
MPSQYAQRNRSAVRRALRTEIESVREKVRAAYILETRRKEGEKLTEEELDIIKERPVNLKLNEALEEMYLRRSSESVERNRTLQEEEIWSLMHFFYLVRLAQQGFFSLISTINPAIEPQALIYLADKMVGHSLHASRSPDEQTRKANKAQFRNTVRSLHAEKEEPVAEGFRTTYKQVMQLIHGLVDQSLGEQSRNEKAAAEEQDNDNTSKPNETVSSKQPPVPTIPPVWVVMPYSSMIDGATFAMPGAVPTLPYPSTLLPTHMLPRHAFPFMHNPSDEPKRRSNKKKSKKDKNTSINTAPAEEEAKDHNEKTKESVESTEESKESTEKAKEEPAEEVKEQTVTEAEQEVQTNEQFEDNDYDDRFADPETSDEEVREEEEEDEEDDGELTMLQKEQDQVEETKDQEQNKESKEQEQEKETKEENGWDAAETDHQQQSSENGWGEVSQGEVAADSKWQSFAAASREDREDHEEPNGRSNNSRNSPRKQNRGYMKNKNSRY